MKSSAFIVALASTPFSFGDASGPRIMRDGDTHPEYSKLNTFLYFPSETKVVSFDSSNSQKDPRVYFARDPDGNEIFTMRLTEKGEQHTLTVSVPKTVDRPESSYEVSVGFCRLVTCH